jgi:hypothetical protein
MKMLIAAILLSACAHLDMDRSVLNHPLMNLKQRNTPVAPRLSNLGSIDAASTGGKCVSCAH